MTQNYEDEYPTDPAGAIRDILSNIKMDAHGDDLFLLDTAIYELGRGVKCDTMIVGATVISFLQRSSVEDNVYIIELVKALRYTYQMDQMNPPSTLNDEEPTP